MKMKKHLFTSWLAVGVLALGFAACASEDNAGKGEPKKTDTIPLAMGKPLRGFIDSTVYKTSLASPAKQSRMTGIYGNISSGGTGIKFFFDKDEDYVDGVGSSGYGYLYVNTGTDASPSWQQFGNSGTYSEGGNNIPYTQTIDTDADGNVITALFHTRSSSVRLTNESYKIRYGYNYYHAQGSNNSYVNIQTQQYQKNPGKATRLAYYGDYATATAEDNGMYYDFVLNHHSAYITFMPYAGTGDSHDALAQCKLWKVRILSDQAMGGVSFPVNDNGYNIVTWPTSGQKYIDLYCQEGNNAPTTSSTLNYTIATSQGAAKSNGAIMVLAPGTYTNVKIEYYVYDKVVNNLHVFTKEIPSLTLNSGKNQPIYSELKCKDYTSEYFTSYHMWGANAVYWNTGIGGPYHNWQPSGNNMDSGTPSYVIPQVGQGRYFSNVNGSLNADIDAPASSLDHDAPTANLMEAYATQPHYWDDEPFTYDGHLFSGRMWFLKKSFIADLYGMSESDLSTVNGSTKPTKTNYVTYSSNYSVWNSNAGNWAQLPAAQKANYFYVLPLGGYYNGVLYGMTSNISNGYTEAGYWTSTALVNNTAYSWMLRIEFTYSDYKMTGASTWMFTTYYRRNLSGDRSMGYPKWPGETHTYVP